MHKRSLAVYTFAHFAVDFACFYVLFSTVSAGIQNTQQLAFWFLTYNIIAFGLQFVIGYFCDTHRSFPAGLVFARQIYTALVLIALGNAFFHVGGGIDSLVNARGKLWRSGVFVSSGTWGVVLGTMAGRAGISILYPLGFLMISGVMIHIFCNTKINLSKSSFNVANMKRVTAIAIALIFISVAIRAHTGFSIPITWKTSTFLVLLAAFASFAGKAQGGFAADKLGARLTGVGALLLSAPLLTFFNDNIVLCVIGIFLFNMTMPVTLCALAQYLEGFEGLAFGLTTLALLSGTFVTYISVLNPTYAKYVIIVSIVISAACILITTGTRRTQWLNKEVADV